MTKENLQPEETPSATIIKFPEHRIIREVPQEAIKKMLAQGELNQINDVVDGICSGIFQELMEYGVDVEANTFYKDFSYLCAVAKATVYRNFGIEHELHPFLDETIKVLSEEEFDKMKSEAKENLNKDNE